MSIKTEVDRLNTAKTNIAASVEKKGVNIPSGETLSNYASYIDQIPSGDSGQFEAVITGEITEVKSNIYHLRAGAFSACHALKTVDLPNADKVRIRTFAEAESLISVNLPSVTDLYDSGFYYCGSLTKLKLESLKRFKGNAQFRHCKRLTLLDFPVLTKITGSTSFTDTNLQAIILRSPTICSLEFSSCFGQSPIASGTGYIYVPKALVDQYKAAPNWMDVAAQIRAIEDYPEITEA